LINGFSLAIITIVFFIALFVIAWFGDQQDTLIRNRKFRAAIYSCSIAVYCTSWSYYGSVSASVSTGTGFIPLYLGPILAMLFGAPLIARLVRISKRQNTTSLADFIASRYGKSQSLAVIVTIISLAAILPHIALQLKALSMGYDLLINGEYSRSIADTPFFQDAALYIVIVMGLFSVLFGIRQIDATEHHRGLIRTIAFESVVKIIAFVLVGIYVSLFLFSGWGDIASQLHTSGIIDQFWPGNVSTTSFIAYTLLGGLAIFCLPRQFHVTIVENHETKDVYSARWTFPLYLLAMMLFVLPVAAAGTLLFPVVPPDPGSFIITIPLFKGPEWLAILAFTGGVSAATAMIIVSTITLSTMLSNEILAPALLRIRTLDLSHRRNVQLWLLNLRRATVYVTLFVSYCLYRLLGDDLPLSSMGLLSLAAVAQFAPSLLGGVIWRNGNRQGAISGLLAGFGIWAFTLLMPAILMIIKPDSTLLTLGIAEISWLRPTALFGLEGPDFVTHGALWSLTVNLVLYLLISVVTTQRMTEKIQVASFLDRSHHTEDTPDTWIGTTNIEDITALAERFLGSSKATETLKAFSRKHQIDLQPKKTASPELIKHFEKQLARAIGSSTARVVLNSALKGKHMQIEDVVSIVDETSQVIKFNRELLQAAIENMNLGVSVVDNNLNVVAWNSRYLEIFNYPRGFLKMGRPMADLLRYNLLMNQVPASRAQQIVEDRLALMREGKAHEYERMRPDGSVILIQGNPMPGGGFVTTFSDISAMRRTELALKETNTYLEERVNVRTEELSKLNEQLAKAKSTAEHANQSKTRFLASASHDLLQPLNAARLFTSALANKVRNTEAYNELVTHIDSSLNAAEEILSTLLDISKLDAGVYEPHYSTFNINELLRNLNTEFNVIAQDKKLELRTVFFDGYVCSDHQLLRRVIQNFISNAIRYTKEGRILLGCRKRGQNLRIEVWDTGPGIPQAQLKSIFEEFKRFNHGESDKNGLGLGLAIVERISKMLGYPVEVRSTPGMGSMFAITVPLLTTAKNAVRAPPKKQVRSVVSLVGTEVFCIDNEPAILEGMRALLEGWGCNVHTGSTPEQAVKCCLDFPPEVMLADFQLDEGKSGLDTMDMLRKRLDRKIPGILVTAVNSDEVKEAARKRDYQILHKPLKPAALRAMINKVMSKS
jgi:Na+/proline symporter/signal transduction histidine kinase